MVQESGSLASDVHDSHRFKDFKDYRFMDFTGKNFSQKEINLLSQTSVNTTATDMCLQAISCKHNWRSDEKILLSEAHERIQSSAEDYM